ncbi:MAG: hypothetical protein IPI00_12285 [Flavobacteriales bacterium]|nr:hypothetical protein [Flavobacteriales bacterium]MBK6943192.1 hypothetical protein [Flavobacteriales bacterium]MBK7240927.1 hypothetical protein [Flavobacteriales bacterium]MBK9536278.1 hypothetical protein [Flavobacteriales bacterium]
MLIPQLAFPQFTWGGQLLQRSEFRNGYGKLMDTIQDPAFFISHRARLHASFTHNKVSFFMSVQDVRTWGSTAQANASDDFLSVHEAWSEIKLDTSWTLKLGLQELNYDNARFLGNLDWALQARSHDIALLKFEKNKTKLHVGAAFNAAQESLTHSPYAVANQYKVAQMLWIEQGWTKFKFSALLWNNGLQYTTTDSLGALTEQGVRYTQTIGLPTIRYENGGLTLSGFYYQQIGEDVGKREVEAYDANVQASYKFEFNKEKGSALLVTLGGELLSGTAQDATDKVNRSYAPMYGTNHAHNGYMDHFYVGGRGANSVGLMDVYVRVKYDLNKRTFLSMNIHELQAPADVVKDGKKMDNRLGNEIDLTMGRIVNDVVSVQVGYSQLFVTKTLQHLEGVPAMANIQNWAYIAILYRPNIKKRFTGLQF